MIPPWLQTGAPRDGTACSIGHLFNRASPLDGGCLNTQAGRRSLDLKGQVRKHRRHAIAISDRVEPRSVAVRLERSRIAQVCWRWVEMGNHIGARSGKPRTLIYIAVSTVTVETIALAIKNLSAPPMR
jgi:hypothetical protein